MGKKFGRCEGDETVTVMGWPGGDREVRPSTQRGETGGGGVPYVPLAW